MGSSLRRPDADLIFAKWAFNIVALLYFQSSEFIRAKCVVYLVRVVCVGGLRLLRSRSSTPQADPENLWVQVYHLSRLILSTRRTI